MTLCTKGTLALLPDEEGRSCTAWMETSMGTLSKSIEGYDWAGARSEPNLWRGVWEESDI